MRIWNKCLVVILSITLSFVWLPIPESNAISTSAKAFCVMCADTGEVLASSNAHLRLSMASTTKIMTALILAELNTLDKEIVTTKEMVTVEGSSMGVLEGDSISYYELLVGMLLASGNDAANTTAIAVSGSVEAFAKLMNKRANEIGMKNTNFVTPSGLDDDEHYSTAFDMSLLACEALKNDTIRNIVSQKKITISYGNPPYQRTLYNHNKLLGSYEYCIGVKTGFTKKSGRCLVSAAEKDNCRVVAVTLNNPNDWSDHEALLDFGLSELKLHDITADFENDKMNVVGGAEDSVSIATESFSLGCTESSKESITYKINLPPFIYAPVTLGQVIGNVEYFYNSKLIHKKDIIALHSVEYKIYEPSFFESFKSKVLMIMRFFV